MLPLSLKKSVFYQVMCYSVLKVSTTPRKPRRSKYLQSSCLCAQGGALLHSWIHTPHCKEEHSKHANLENTCTCFTACIVLHSPSCFGHCSPCNCTYWKIRQSSCSVLYFLSLSSFPFICLRNPLPFLLRQLNFLEEVGWAIVMIALQICSCKTELSFDRSLLKMYPFPLLGGSQSCFEIGLAVKSSKHQPDTSSTDKFMYLNLKVA